MDEGRTKERGELGTARFGWKEAAITHRQVDIMDKWAEIVQAIHLL